MRRLLTALAMIFFLPGLTGCSGTAPVTLDEAGNARVRLSLNWYPEAEHGGFYAADVHNLFDEHDLSVEIIPGGPSAPQLVISELVSGRTHFAISDADQVVKARAEGLPIVAIMATMQNSPRCIMVHEATGITRLEDLADVDLAISETRPFALWMKRRLPLKNVRLVPYNGLVGEFLQNERFAQQGFVFSEPFVAREKGSNPRSLMVSDIGFNPYAGLLITTDTMVASHPDVVRAMVAACAQGWKRYLALPQPTNDVLHQMNSDMSPAALAFGAEEIVRLCEAPAGEEPFTMSGERWSELVKQIEEIGEIPAGSVDPAACFTSKFIMPAQG